MERESVLVVDDEASVRGPIGRVLSGAGFEVVFAQSGQEAIDLITSRSFDVILSDIDMPKLDGVQLLRLIRLRGLDVPVLLMTGRPHHSTASQAIALGALEYLVKPIAPADVTAAVTRAARLNSIARLRRDAFELVHEQEAAKADLEAKFQRALDGLWMAFQPIVPSEAKSGEGAFAYEALLRSSDPVLPDPGAIIGAAERLGRLADLGRGVRSAVASAAAEAPPSSLLFVNLHARDLMDDELYSPAAPLSKLAPRVVLEITERVSLHDTNDVRDRVGVLRRLGYRIAIDDLGAGYSGLSAFASLEPEFVKLDMSLVRDVDTHPVKQRLVAALMEVCRELHINVVSEGVETNREFETLLGLGCPLLQGYLFGMPSRGFITPTR